MKLTAMLIGAALALSAASSDTFLIRNVDVYPVTAPEMKGVSLRFRYLRRAVSSVSSQLADKFSEEDFGTARLLSSGLLK